MQVGGGHELVLRGMIAVRRSRLAGEPGRSDLSLITDTPLSPASRLLQILSTPNIVCLAENQCRSALARESGVSVTNQSPDSPLSPASRLLHSSVIWLYNCVCHRGKSAGLRI